MYTIKSNGVRDDVVNNGAIKTTFDALSKKLGDTDFLVSIIAHSKDDSVNEYECDITSSVMKGDNGHINTKGADLLTVCKEGADMFHRRWRAQKSEWKKNQKEG